MSGASIDVRRFHAAFCEECHEHIETIEAICLGFDNRRPDSEELDAMFRAAHSIKGGAATFGFPLLASTTHAVESVLDDLRAGTLVASDDLVRILLRACDVLGAQVADAQDGVEPDAVSASELVNLLQAFATEPPVGNVSEMFGFFEQEAAAPPTLPESAERATPTVRTEGGSIRVELAKLDGLINLVGEMVIAQSMLSEAAGGVGEARSVRFNAAIEKIERHTRDLRESVMSVRMVPIGSVFARFTRVVHDMAAALGKSAQLQIEGGESEIDKVLTERLVDPLTHLVRNSLDHGIETPATRRAAGKPDAGTIVLRASHNSGQIVIEVSDDGAGLDRERILAKAAERGIAIDEAAPDALVWDLIFAPGFSTAGEISDVSGRGVGMDVVRRNVAALRGSVEIQSTADAGTRTIIRMPLTLAILDGLSVSVGDETFIVPLTAIVESVPVSRAKIAHLHRRGRVMEFRAEWISVVSLSDLFGIVAPAPENPVAMVFEADGVRAALLVDALNSEQQVVIKSVETHFRAVDGVAGATVLGTGRVALILDLAGLLRMAGVDADRRSGQERTVDHA